MLRAIPVRAASLSAPTRPLARAAAILAVRGVTSAAPTATTRRREEDGSGIPNWVRFPAPSIEDLPVVKSLEEFQALAAEGNATVEHAHSYLYASKAAIRHLPLDERKQAAAKLGGGLILNWMWKHQLDDWNDRYSRELTRLVCWAIHAEGREELIWEWLEMEARHVKSAHGYERKYRWGERMRWANRVLGGIIDAHLDWDKGRNATSALLQFKRAVDTFSGPLSETLNFVSGSMALQRRLARYDAPPCDTELFEWYTQLRLTRFEFHWRLSIATLGLYHPTQADALTWYNMLREQLDQTSEPYFVARRPSAIHSIGSLSLRAAFILHHQGRETQAKWLEDIIEQYFPRVWKYRDSDFRQYQRDPKLQTLLRSSLKDTSQIRSSLSSTGTPRDE